MKTPVFSKDVHTDKELILTPGAPIESPARRISAKADATAVQKGDAFAKEIAKARFNSAELSVKNIAFLSGFTDPLYFSTVFKKIVGMSPKAYIKSRGTEKNFITDLK